MPYVVKSLIKVQIIGESTEAWQKRHIVFELLKRKYDINLYHENK